MTSVAMDYDRLLLEPGIVAILLAARGAYHSRTRFATNRWAFATRT
jgi:hypothetical protein